jgi:hypothetical protein
LSGPWKFSSGRSATQKVRGKPFLCSTSEPNYG